MTATDETTGTSRGSSLAPVAPGVLAQVKGSTPWTVADLADKLAGPAPKLPTETPFPKPASPVVFTPALRKALGALRDVVGKVNPSTRRALEPAELAALTAERNAINAVVNPLKKRADVISEYVRTHIDVDAEKRGVAGPQTPRIAAGVAAGHYLLASPGSPYRVPVEGYEDGWSQVYTSGSTHQSLSALEGLLDSGQITRQEYLALTRETRDIAQDKVTAFIARHPERGLEILAAITRRSAPGASLNSPKKPLPADEG